MFVWSKFGLRREFPREEHGPCCWAGLGMREAEPRGRQAEVRPRLLSRTFPRARIREGMETGHAIDGMALPKTGLRCRGLLHGT